MCSLPHSTQKNRLRYLVTGGLGYAGAWISRHLAECGHEVYILSRGEQKKDIGIPYSLVSADLASLAPEELARLLPEDLDGIVHAASFNESFAPDYARKALLITSLGTRNLLQALALHDRDSGRAAPLVIYLSTFHVYGRSEGDMDESCPTLPRNDYALTHLFGEEYCRLFARTGGQPQIVLRVTNGYGAPRTPGSDKWYLLLNDLCRAAVRAREVRLHGPASTLRDFVWLGDLAVAVEKLLRRPDLAGNIFNIASSASRSTGEIAALVAEAASHMLGEHIPVICPPEEASRPQSHLSVNNKAVRDAIGIAFQDRMQEEISSLLRLAASEPDAENPAAAQ